MPLAPLLAQTRNRNSRIDRLGNDDGDDDVDDGSDDENFDHILTTMVRMMMMPVRGPRFHTSAPDPPPGLLAAIGFSLRPTLGRPLDICV